MITPHTPIWELLKMVMLTYVWQLIACLLGAANLWLALTLVLEPSVTSVFAVFNVWGLLVTWPLFRSQAKMRHLLVELIRVKRAREHWRKLQRDKERE